MYSNLKWKKCLPYGLGWLEINAYILCPVTSRNITKKVTRVDGYIAVSGLYQAIADYTAASSDEVSYKAGDAVEVLYATMDGWWKVRYTHNVYISWT